MCKELAVRPAFSDFAVMQYENLARTDDRAESVRDREISSQQGKKSVMREAFEQAALAPYAAESFSWC